MDIKALSAFKALADRTRLRILNLLLGRELNVNEIVRILKTGQSGISRHLKILTDSGLVRCRKDGLWSFFQAAADGEHAALFGYLRGAFAGEPPLLADERSAARAVAQREKESRRLFDSLAPRWERMKKEILGDVDLNDGIAGRIGTAGTVADLGCGTGDLIETLRGRANKIVGVDSSPEMIRAARERFAARRSPGRSGAAGNGTVDIRMGDFEHLPLADGEADAAICSLVLHHLSDPARGLREAARILAPGGRIVLADLASHSDEALRTRSGDRRLGFAPKTMEIWLEKAGFENIKMDTIPVKRNHAVLVWSADKKR